MIKPYHVHRLLKWEGSRALLNTWLGLLDSWWSLLSAVNRALSRFRRGQQRKRVLLVATNYMIANQLRMPRDLLNGDERIEVFVTKKPFAEVVELDTKVLSEISNATYVRPIRAMLRRWDLILFSAHVRAFSPNPRIPKVFVSHGIESWKTIDGRIAMFDGTVLRKDKPVYSKIFAKGVDTRSIGESLCPQLKGTLKVVGDLTVDRLLRLNAARERIRSSLGYSDSDIVVIVMSTHGQPSLFANMGEKLLEEAQRLTGSYSFIFTIHPFNFYTSEAAGLRQQAWRALELEAPKLTVVGPDQPWEEHLVAADVAVTDHGSMALYMAQLNRPIITARQPNYEPYEGSPPWRLQSFSPQLLAPDQLGDLIDQALTSYPYSELTRLADDICAHKGQAAEVWRAELYDSLKLEAVNPRDRTGSGNVWKHTQVAKSSSDDALVENKPMSKDRYRCNFCSSLAKQHWEGFVKCSNCHLIIRETMPSAKSLDDLYESSWEIPEANLAETGSLDHTLARGYLQSMCSTVGISSLKGLTIIDFGAGMGGMLQAMLDMGVNAFGVEPFGYDYLIEKGLPVYKSLEDLPASLEIDGVFSSNVVEHLENPIEFIRDIYARLSPGGWFFVTTPNGAGAHARIYRGAWREAVKAGHLIFFTPESLDYYLAEVGFSSVKRSKHDMNYGHSRSRNLLQAMLNRIGMEGELKYLATK